MIAPLTISTDMFWWDPEMKEFRQEISTLNLPKDATFQKGITLKNPKTCNTEHFMYERTCYDLRENEVTHWEFKSLKHKLSMLIWND